MEGISNMDAFGGPLVYESKVTTTNANPASSSKRNTGTLGASVETPSSK